MQLGEKTFVGIHPRSDYLQVAEGLKERVCHAIKDKMVMTESESKRQRGPETDCCSIMVLPAGG